MGEILIGASLRRVNGRWELRLDLPRWAMDALDQDGNGGYAVWRVSGMGFQGGGDGDSPAHYNIGLESAPAPADPPPLIDVTTANAQGTLEVDLDDLLYDHTGKIDDSFKLYAVLPDNAYTVAPLGQPFDGVDLAMWSNSTGRGMDYLYYCGTCEGWIDASPGTRTVDDLGLLSGRRGIVTYCKRCGHELSFRGAVS